MVNYKSIGKLALGLLLLARIYLKARMRKIVRYKSEKEKKRWPWIKYHLGN